MRILILEDDYNRIAKFVTWYGGQHALTIVNNAEDCIQALQASEDYGFDFDYIFLDHDLGGQVYVDESLPNTGSEVARWMMQNFKHDPHIVIHSHNHPAAANMARNLLSYGFPVTVTPFNSNHAFSLYI